jgi:hypothetical protein
MGPVGKHIIECTSSELSMDHVTVVTTTTKSNYFLMTLEALVIDQLKPNLNTKDEYRSRALVIKI